MLNTAKVFANGGSQAIRLPREFRFECDEVCIKRVGSSIVIYDPRDRMRLMSEALDRFSDDFLADGRDQGEYADPRDDI